MVSTDRIIVHVAGVAYSMCQDWVDTIIALDSSGDAVVNQFIIEQPQT